jgi:uncharacterized protein
MPETIHSLDSKLNLLLHWLTNAKRVLVAYSGGVDSSLLLYAATKTLGPEALGILAVSPSLPEAEHQQAVELAKAIGARLEQIQTKETHDPKYQANAVNRCFHCKDHVYGALRLYANEHHYEHVIDGMNLEDTLDLRPGRAAAKLHGIQSPLHEIGFSKADVRAAAKKLGLSNWNKPAAACLASRIPYGTTVTPKLLSQIERAEMAVLALGFHELRVRHHGDVARLEVPEKCFPDVLIKREELLQALKTVGYTYIALDLEGLRHGSMNEVMTAR